MNANEFLTKNSILKMKEEVEVSEFDGDFEKTTYLIRLDNRHWKVSKIIYYIFCAIDGTRNLSDIKEYLYTEHSINIGEQELETIIDKAFVQNGLLEGTTASTSPPENKMLWGKFTLISPNIIKKFRFLNFMFKKSQMIIFSSIVLLWMLYIFSTNSNISVVNEMYGLDIKEIIICYMFISAMGIAHELGHSVATMFYNVEPGRIGIGVYFIMPILFSDVTKIWRLKRHQRVIVDIGGMYFQGIALVISFLINTFFVKSNLLNIAILMSGFQLFGNFNPFIKFDGYWVLSDYLGTTEIRTVMFELWVDLFNKILGKKQKYTGFSKVKKVILYIYSICTILFFGYFFKFLIQTLIVGIHNISSDISLFIKFFPYGIEFSFNAIQQYLSNRLTTFIALSFFARTIWRYIIKNIYNWLKCKLVHAKAIN